MVRAAAVRAAAPGPPDRLVPQMRPPGDIRYASEKFGMAVYLLATGAGPIKERLYHVYIEVAPVGERDIPEQLLGGFRWIRSELTKREPTASAVIDGKVVVGAEGRIGATLGPMRNAHAVRIAERICAVADRLRELTQIG